MGNVYIVESCGEMSQVNFQQGPVMVQNVKLRELTGNTAFTQHWVVENSSGTNLSDHVGKPIACCIENYVSQSKMDGREFNNLRIREVVKLGTDNGVF